MRVKFQLSSPKHGHGRTYYKSCPKCRNEIFELSGLIFKTVSCVKCGTKINARGLKVARM